MDSCRGREQQVGKSAGEEKGGHGQKIVHCACLSPYQLVVYVYVHADKQKALGIKYRKVTYGSNADAR